MPIQYKLEDFGFSKITPATIRRMHELVKLAKTDPTFLKLINDIIRKCPPRDDSCQLRTIYSTWHNKIKYLKDPFQVEKLQSVWVTIKNRSGDCDCSSILVAASVGAIGYQYRFVIIKANPERPDDWSHVYTEVEVPGQGWIGMDVSLRQPQFGFSPKGWKIKYWPEPAY